MIGREPQITILCLFRLRSRVGADFAWDFLAVCRWFRTVNSSPDKVMTIGAKVGCSAPWAAGPAGFDSAIGANLRPAGFSPSSLGPVLGEDLNRLPQINTTATLLIGSLYRTFFGSRMVPMRNANHVETLTLSASGTGCPRRFRCSRSSHNCARTARKRFWYQQWYRL